MHSFKSHFSWLFDRYNNRLTVHAYTIAKGSTVCFYWGLIHGPVWRPRMLGWSVNGSNLPGQADSWQRITTRLAGETGHQCSYILWHVELKTAWVETIWPLESEGPATVWTNSQNGMESRPKTWNGTVRLVHAKANVTANFVISRFYHVWDHYFSVVT